MGIWSGRLWVRFRCRRDETGRRGVMRWGECERRRVGGWERERRQRRDELMIPLESWRA